MLEARIQQGSVLKKVIDSLRDLVNEANFEFTPSGITLQSMDSAHVILVSLLLRSDGFESYRCDRTIPVGINMGSLGKIIRSAANDDAITLRADDSGRPSVCSLKLPVTPNLSVTIINAFHRWWTSI